MAIPQFDQVQQLATKYNKQQLQRMAAMGQIDPTMAVMAGMMIDRIVQSNIKKPTTTVAEDAGIAALPPAQQTPQLAQMGAPTAPEMEEPQTAARTMTAADGGLMSLPIPDSMYDDSYAGGGVVAFAAGDLVGQDMFGFTQDELGPMSREELVSKLSLSELQEYNRSGKLPARLKGVLEGRTVGGKPQLGGMPFTTSYPEFAAPSVVTTTPPAAGAGALPAAVPPRGDQVSTTPTAAPAATPAAPAYQDITPEKFKELQKQFGIDDSYKTAAEAAIAKLRETGGDREQAKNMALLQAGLGIMGGTSASALENIGKGAAPAVQQYAKEIKDIKAVERDADKMQLELAKAEDARKRGDFKAYQDHIEKARDLDLKLRKVIADEKQTEAYVKAAGRPSEEQLRQGFFARDEKGFRRYQEAMRPGFETAEANRNKVALEQINNALLVMKKDDPRRKELEDERKRILARLSGTGGGGLDVPPNVQAVIDKHLGKAQ